MEPRIQYVKTSDGVSIAYAVSGEGPLIVFASNIWGTLHMSQWWTGPSPATAINGLVDFDWSQCAIADRSRQLASGCPRAKSTRNPGRTAIANR